MVAYFRRSVHRNYIAHVYGNRLYSQVFHRHKGPVKVDVFDERVGGNYVHLALTNLVDSRIITDGTDYGFI